MVIWDDLESLSYDSCLLIFNTDAIWAKSWENLLLPYVNNKAADQPARMRSLISVYKAADQPAHSRSLISAFVVRSLDSIISLVSVSEISSF